jgi:glycosyltransferase involved in cell wall biosynthesis
MRIGHVTFGYRPIRGGAETYLEQLRLVLEAAGHAQTVYQRSTGELGLGIVPVLTSPRFSPGRQFWSLAATLLLRLPQLVREELLIVHYPQYVPAVAWHRRLVGLSHGVTWDDAPGSRSARVKKAFARFAFRRCHQYVANDTFFLREMGLAAPPGERPFEELAPGRWFIPNGVDVDWWRPVPPRPGLADRFVVLVPRNLYRNRGIHLAIAAFPEIRAAFPEAYLVIAGGDGPADYRAEMDRQVEALGIQDRILWLGSIPWRDMREVYAAARVSLIPSLCGEGTSLSALESAACGTPVVATEAGGLTDLPVVHCRVDAADLAAKTIALLQHRDAEAHRQRAAVVEGFTIEKWGAAWLKVITRARHPQPAP